MYGIAGFSGDLDRHLLSAMSQSLARCGPDGHGDFLSPEHGIGLAHRRLAVIEPTSEGDQPRALLGGSFVVAYKREIYNYREQAAGLAGLGHQVRGRTETEILLHLDRQHWLDMFDQSHGICAFALWDAERRSLLQACDGFGAKPLYCCEMPAGVLSESACRRRDPFDLGPARTIVQRARTGLVDGAYLILRVLFVEWWCRMFLDRRVVT